MMIGRKEKEEEEERRGQKEENQGSEAKVKKILKII